MQNDVEYRSQIIHRPNTHEMTVDHLFGNRPQIQFYEYWKIFVFKIEPPWQLWFCCMFYFFWKTIWVEFIFLIDRSTGTRPKLRTELLKKNGGFSFRNRRFIQLSTIFKDFFVITFDTLVMHLWPPWSNNFEGTKTSF